MRRGRGGRRKERVNRSLVARHEILGVGPKHGFILQNQSGGQTQNDRMGGRKQTKEKVIRLTELSSDRLFTVNVRKATDGPNQPRGPLAMVPSPGAPSLEKA